MKGAYAGTSLHLWKDVYTSSIDSDCIPNNVPITDMVAGGRVWSMKSNSSSFSLEHMMV